MSTQTTVQATDHALLGWAYEAHCENCATCRRGETWCETGAAILTAIATTNTNTDLPGYQAI
jgi:Zn-dependent alcohol dehydrogenase